MAAADGPIIVTATMTPADFAWADDLRRRWFPPERNRVSAHITLFHHLPPSGERELRALLADLTQSKPPAARIDRLLNLGGGVAFHVDSPNLLAIRAEIAERFHGLLTPQDAGNTRLHITVQNKVSAQTARETAATLAADFQPRSLGISGLACWHYEGEPWAPIAEYKFRG
ncbi:2'-5' RNA ligase family protein [Sphingobium sp. CR28]|uniref:2'-5' RNA ligase family protein n=1 Tax=Sphingobium sp. CR28 TaxID=3400272 RepID=UPI003FEF8A0D